jgi:hypothetical protein
VITTINLRVRFFYVEPGDKSTFTAAYRSHIGDSSDHHITGDTAGRKGYLRGKVLALADEVDEHLIHAVYLNIL